jgi:hypothetical protein
MSLKWERRQEFSQEFRAPVRRIIVQEEYRYRNRDASKALQEGGNQRTAVIEKDENINVRHPGCLPEHLSRPIA